MAASVILVVMHKVAHSGILPADRGFSAPAAGAVPVAAGGGGSAARIAEANKTVVKND